MSKDILDALTNALMGSGSLPGNEVSQKWYTVVSDGEGGTQSYEASSLFHAQTMTKEWLATGWPAWVEDDKGHALVLAKKPREKN